MSTERPTNEPGRSADCGGAFCTTQWTQVLAARGNSEPARAALADLCGAYYEPVIAFLRRTGHEQNAAREIAHDFFASLLQGDPLANVRREGHFRSYLLGALKHFLAHRRARELRAKRGGGVEPVSLDGGTDTTTAVVVPDTHAPAPDAAFDRAWATTVLSRALVGLRKECAAEGKEGQFEQLKPWLTGECERGDQAQLARSLGMDSAALKSAIHRLKQRYRQLVKTEVGSTLNDPGGVEQEMLALFTALGG